MVSIETGCLVLPSNLCRPSILLVGLLAITGVLGKCVIKHEKGNTRGMCSKLGLTDIPQDLPDDIDRLYMNENELTIIRNKAMERYKQLQYLFIRHNKISYLEEDAFFGLSNLLYLNLAGNFLNVSSYPPNLFVPIRNLLVLDIRQNTQNSNGSPVMYSTSFKTLKLLKEIYIDLVQEPVFEDTFSEMQQLQKVWFEYCYIHSLTNESFENVTDTVTELYIRNCSTFFTIQSNVLQHFPKLRKLDLQNSHLHLTQAFKLLYPLRYRTMKLINFQRVTFPSIKEYDYDIILTPELMEYISTICINDLNLAGNNIVAVWNKSILLFKHPECFVNIILSGNRFGIEQFTTDIVIFFWKMTKLHLFDFSYLPLEFKNPVFLEPTYGDALKNFGTVSRNSEITLFIPPQLQNLRLTHVMANIYIDKIFLINSNLVYLDLSFLESSIFPCLIFHGKIRLRNLDLSGIKADTTLGKFPILNNLEVLKMSHAEFFYSIRRNTSIFNWVPNVEYLDLSYNYMWNLNENSLGTLDQLRILNLSHNMFQYVPHALQQYSKIRELDLSYNLIAGLEKHFTDWVDAYKDIEGYPMRLNLLGNAFVCSCETAEFIRWLFTTKVNLDMKGNYTCLMPDGNIDYTKNVYRDFHLHFADCKSKTWLKLGISLLSSTVFAITCAIIVYNCRWRLIFILHRRFRKFAEGDLKMNFKYDAYVSYSADSAKFVKKVLQPTIERQWGLRMCCEDRDFSVGDSSADLRANSIHQSRHVIFIVTPTFMHNEWSRYEIERAKYEKFTKDLQKIVVIAKEVTSAQVPKELVDIWKDVYLIEWPNSEDEIRDVWKKLRLWFF